MQDTRWFDPDTNETMFAQYVDKMASWQAAIADGKIDEQEVAQQAQRVEDLLRKLEPQLDADLHQQLTEVFYELAVFYGMVQAVDIATDEEG